MRICLLLGGLMLGSAAGTMGPLTEEARRLQLAYTRATTAVESEAAQRAYVQEFPGSAAAFCRIFQATAFDQLYEQSYDYIRLWQKLGRRYPQPVLHKCVAIGKNLRWQADAVGYLQKSTVQLAVAHPEVFAREVRLLRDTEQRKLFGFLADVENHSRYPEYGRLVEQLRRAKAADLAGRMEAAKKQRQYPSH